MRVLFFHVAKTGGMSVRRMLLSPHGLKDFDCYHNGALLEFRAGAMTKRRKLHGSRLGFYDYMFGFVRNPYQRLLSCYQYFLNGGLNQFHPGCQFPADREIQKFLLSNFPSFDLCCQNLDVVANKIPHMRPVTEWMRFFPPHISEQLSIGRTETLLDGVHDILLRLGLDPALCRLPHVNRTLSSEQPVGIDGEPYCHVRAFYAQDYDLFSYD